MKIRPKLFIYLVTIILCLSLSGCGSVSQSDNQQVVSEEPIATEEIIDNGEESNLDAELEPEIGEFSLSDDTKKFVFGKWRVKKLLGFYRSWNDASEYPNGDLLRCRFSI